MAAGIALLLWVVAEAARLGLAARPRSHPLPRLGEAAWRGALHGIVLVALAVGLVAAARRLGNAYLIDTDLAGASSRALPLALGWSVALLLTRGRLHRLVARLRPFVLLALFGLILWATRETAVLLAAALPLAGLSLLPWMLAKPPGVVWAHLRAAWLLAHVAAITLFALPAPVGGMNRGDWKDPTVQTELSAWAGRLHLSEERLEDGLWQAAVEEMAIRDRVTTPLQPYIFATGTDQPWRMFVAPHHFPTRLSIEVRRQGGEFEPVFVERSDRYTWRRDLFDQERLRSGIFRHTFNQFRWDARNLCAWAANGLFAERPEVVEVRCRLYRARLPSPEEARAGVDPPGSWEETDHHLRPGLTPTPTPAPAPSPGSVSFPRPAFPNLPLIRPLTHP